MKRYPTIHKLRARLFAFALCLALVASAAAAGAAEFHTDDIWTLNFYDEGGSPYVTVTRLENAYTSSLEGVTVDGKAYAVNQAGSGSVLRDDYGNVWQAKFGLASSFGGSYEVNANSELLTIQIDGGREVSYSREDLAGCITTNSAGMSYSGDKTGLGDRYYGIATEYITMPQLFAFLGVDASSVTSVSFRPIDWEGNTGYIRTLNGAEISPAVLALKSYQCDTPDGATADKADTLNAFRLIPATSGVTGFDSVKWINHISISTGSAAPQPSNPGSGTGTGSGGGSVSAGGSTTVNGGTSVTVVDKDSLSNAVSKADKNTQIVLDSAVPLEDAAKKVMVLTGEDLKLVAESGASVKAELTFASVVLSNAALQELDSKNASEITISATSLNNGTLIEVTADGTALDQVDGGLLVSLPVSQPSSGTVMVLVNSDGTETILKKSASGADAVSAVVSGSCTVKIVDNTKTFADVKSGDWYADTVAFVTSRELFNGVTDTDFAPTAPMTRAMLVTVLHRLENTPKVQTPNTFADVADGLWYTGAVAWANENGIVTGTGTGFAPDGNVTRGAARRDPVPLRPVSGTGRLRQERFEPVPRCRSDL